MHSTSRVLALAAAVCLTVAACGDDDGTAASDRTTTIVPTTCVDRFVAMANTQEMKDAAASGEDPSKDLQAQLDAFGEDCGDEMDHLSDQDFTVMMGKIDPDVADYLGTTQTAEFEKTGSAIGG